jgi:hypothetical protein
MFQNVAVPKVSSRIIFESDNDASDRTPTNTPGGSRLCDAVSQVTHTAAFVVAPGHGHFANEHKAVDAKPRSVNCQMPQGAHFINASVHFLSTRSTVSPLAVPVVPRRVLAGSGMKIKEAFTDSANELQRC